MLLVQNRRNENRDRHNVENFMEVLSINCFCQFGSVDQVFDQGIGHGLFRWVCLFFCGLFG